MTPVQLPEVPEPFMDLHRDLTPVMYDAWSAQLRAYAIEAMMAERARLRTAVADYIHSEGCSCCRGNDHDEHKAVIAGLLGVAPYSDNSGFDFAPYRTGATQPEQNSER